MPNIRRFEEPAKPKTEKTADVPIMRDYNPTLCISSKKLPELIDFNVDEEIEITILCKVKSVRAIDADESDEKKAYHNYDLEVVGAGVNNVKPERKKADERGLSKEDSDAIDKKRKERGYKE